LRCSLFRLIAFSFSFRQPLALALIGCQFSSPPDTPAKVLPQARERRSFAAAKQALAAPMRLSGSAQSAFSAFG